MTTPSINELDSGEYEISTKGETLGYAWMNIDKLGNRMSYFVLHKGIPFPFELADEQSLEFTKTKLEFSDPKVFYKAALDQLDVGDDKVDAHSLLEASLGWDPTCDC